MVLNSTVLCIHCDPEQLTLLKEKGYGLVTATNGSDGLRLLMTETVDAVVLEYYLGRWNGAVVAEEIRHMRPHLPIVMVADPQALPHGALESVDTLVDESAGPHFLWAAVHFLLSTKPEQGGYPITERPMMEGWMTEGGTIEGHLPGRTVSRKRAKPLKHLVAARVEETNLFPAGHWKSISAWDYSDLSSCGLV
jgi:DNA-binding response OmpR family regulator